MPHAAIRVAMHVAHHCHQGAIVNGGQCGSQNNCAEHVGAVNNRGIPATEISASVFSWFDHVAPP